MMDEQLPKTWDLSPLDRLTVHVLGGDWGKHADYDDPDYACVRCIRASELREWESELGSTAALRKIKKSSLASRELRSGDIVVEVSGGGPEQPVGRTVLINCAVLAKNPEYPKVCTNFFRQLRPAGEMNSSFLDLYLKFFYKTGRIVAYQGGSNNLRNLKFDDYLKLRVPIPPAAEQHRIVTKIEELFSELDKAVENLEKAREQLKVYRQAVLKHAFEGKLTAQWREENKDKLENPEQLLARIEQERKARYEIQFKRWNTSVKAWEEAGRSGKKRAKPRKPLGIAPSPDASSDELPELSEGWIWVRVGSICEVVRGGSPRPAGDTRYYDGAIPFLKVADLTRTAGAYVETHSYSIKEAGLRKTRLVNPPVLMLSNSGATLGVPKICRIRTTFNDGIAAFLGLDENDLLYHYYFWISKTSELRAINQGAAQPNLNTGLIQDVKIPLCSKNEMEIVAREIGRALSICEQLNADIDAQLTRSEALRQSILKKAFAGQLVAQDSNDEPASELLKRIKAEKAGQYHSTKLHKKRRRAKATA